MKCRVCFFLSVDSKTQKEYHLKNEKKDWTAPNHKQFSARRLLNKDVFSPGSSRHTSSAALHPSLQGYLKNECEEKGLLQAPQQKPDQTRAPWPNAMS